jgi:membrane protein implicated in regulation of membrane protease activity
MTTFARYLALQIPSWTMAALAAWALHYWLDLSTVWGIAIVLAFLAKDLLLFPFVRRAYEHDPHEPGKGLIGRDAEVVVDLDGEGWVKLGAERWRARLVDQERPQLDDDGPATRIPAGTRVRVHGLRRHTLLVSLSDAGTGENVAVLREVK